MYPLILGNSHCDQEKALKSSAVQGNLFFFFGVGFQQDRVQGWPLHSASRLVSLGMFVRVVILELLLCCSGLFRTIPL